MKRKRVIRDSTEPFILTAFDEYRARLRDAFIVFLLVILVDILVGLFKPFSAARNSWFLVLSIVTLVTVGFLVFFIILYHKKQKEEMKVVLLIDGEGIVLSSSEQTRKEQRFAWKQIKTVSIRKPAQRTIYLTIEKRNGSRTDFDFFPYAGAFNLYRLKSSLIHYAAGRAEIEIKIPLWFYNY